MSDTPVPQEISNWMSQRNWGTHHLEWHATRLWDAVPQLKLLSQQRGWPRAAMQEGAAGNGLEFLAMHRVMIRQLLAAFPQYSGLFRGWQTPPTDPGDPNDPVPDTSPAGGSFDGEMLNAVARIQGPAQAFADDDDFGLFIETSRRPLSALPATLRKMRAPEYTIISMSGSPTIHQARLIWVIRRSIYSTSDFGGCTAGSMPNGREFGRRKAYPKMIRIIKPRCKMRSTTWACT